MTAFNQQEPSSSTEFVEPAVLMVYIFFCTCTNLLIEITKSAGKGRNDVPSYRGVEKYCALI